MNKLLKLCAIAFTAATVMWSCSKEEDSPLSVDESVEVTNQSIATSLIDLMQDGSSRNEIVDFLSQNNNGGSLQKVYNLIGENENNSSSLNQVAKILGQSDKEVASAEETGIVKIPELWMYTPKSSFKSTDVLISFAPEGDEESWDKITAFDLEGNVHFLDPIKTPDQPVVVVELNGMESLKLRVELMNKELKSYGLQRNNSIQRSLLKASGGLETTKITKVSIKDNKEPWIKGSSEIYAITSGIRGSENNKEAEIQIVAMPYLDESNVDYYPNQVILFWDDYAYQAANIQIYELDSNYNYKELVQIIVDGVFEITGILSGQAWLAALGKIASAIIAAMPDEWYTDDDDYADSFYTIMKDKTYTDYFGASANAKVSMEPFFIPNN